MTWFTPWKASEAYSSTELIHYGELADALPPPSRVKPTFYYVPLCSDDGTTWQGRPARERTDGTLVGQRCPYCKRKLAYQLKKQQPAIRKELLELREGLDS